MNPNDLDALKARIEIAPAGSMIEVSAVELQELIRDSQAGRDKREADRFFTRNKGALTKALEEIRDHLGGVKFDVGTAIDEIERLK